MIRQGSGFYGDRNGSHGGLSYRQGSGGDPDGLLQGQEARPARWHMVVAIEGFGAVQDRIRKVQGTYVWRRAASPQLCSRRLAQRERYRRRYQHLGMLCARDQTRRRPHPLGQSVSFCGQIGPEAPSLQADRACGRPCRSPAGTHRRSHSPAAALGGRIVAAGDGNGMSASVGDAAYLLLDRCDCATPKVVIDGTKIVAGRFQDVGDPAGQPKAVFAAQSANCHCVSVMQRANFNALIKPLLDDAPNTLDDKAGLQLSWCIDFRHQA
jgi:hypothetical protein